MQWLEIGQWLERAFGPGGLALCALSAALAYICHRLWNRLSIIEEARFTESKRHAEALHEAGLAAMKLATVIEKIADRVEGLAREVRR